MKNLPKEKRDRLILISVSTLVGLVIVYQGLISLQKRTLIRMAQQRVDEQTRLDNAQRLVTSVERFREDLAQKSKVLKGVEAGMASGDLYSWIITQVNTFKVDHAVDIPQFSREVPTEVGVIPSFPYRAALFNIRGRAYYHDFGRFVAEFENTFPHLRIQNIELEPAGNSAATADGSQSGRDDSEKLAFRMEIVTLINPTVQ